KPARMRSSVVFPEPLSPRMVRNSPSAISREMSRRTTFLPKLLATERIERRGSVPTTAGVTAGSVVVAIRREMQTRARVPALHWLLRCLHFVPNLVVLRTARDVLPKVETLLIVVDIVEVKTLLLLRRHKLRSMWICWCVAGHVCHFLLRLRLNHEFE